MSSSLHHTYFIYVLGSNDFFRTVHVSSHKPVRARCVTNISMQKICVNIPDLPFILLTNFRYWHNQEVGVALTPDDVAKYAESNWKPCFCCLPLLLTMELFCICLIKCRAVLFPRFHICLSPCSVPSCFVASNFIEISANESLKGTVFSRRLILVENVPDSYSG